MSPYDRLETGTWTDYSGTAYPGRHKKRMVLDSITSEKNTPPYGNKVGNHSYRKITFQQFEGWDWYRRREIVTGNMVNNDYSHGLWPTGSLIEYNIPDGALSDSVVTASYNKAVSDFNSNIRGNTDLSIDTAQYRQTVGLLGDVRDLVHSVLSLKHPGSLMSRVLKQKAGKPPRLNSRKYSDFVKRSREDRRLAEQGLIQYAKIPATGWLQWTYGIKPTLQSIHDAVSHQARFYNNEFRLIEGRATVRDFKSDFNHAYYAWPASNFVTTVNCKMTCKTKIGVIMRIPDSPLTEVARLSSLNPASIAWELMPYSFVVDWFVNIGGYLRDLETALVYSSYFVRGYKTKLFISETDCVARKRITQWIPPYRVDYDGEASCLQKVVFMSRSRLVSYPYPRPPVINTNLGSGRLLNAAALLGNFLGHGSKNPGSDFQRAVRGKF